nr:hypothetical protein [uncultured Roseateles sp.]
MIRLTVEVAGDAGRCLAWLEVLTRVVSVGGFIGPTAFTRLTDAPVLAATPTGGRLELPLADPSVVSLPAIRSLFDASAADGPVPAPLLRLEGPKDTAEVSELFRRMAQWRSNGRAAVPEFWPMGEPWTLRVDHDIALDESQKDRIVQLLRSFEHLVADAPFLASPAGRYRAMGATRIDWTGARGLLYAVDGVASHAPWPEILCHALLAGVLVPAASRLTLLD